MKGFINPGYPMTNRNMKYDKTWGGTSPRLRPGGWYPDRFLPKVLPDRPGFVGTTQVGDTVGRIDRLEAAKKTGSRGGYRFDPPEYRFLKGNWQKTVAKLDETAFSHDPHPLHRVMKNFYPGDGFKKHMAEAGNGEIYKDRTEVDLSVFSRAAKQFAYDFGAEAVGITKLNRNWMYLQNGEDSAPKEYTHVIIVAVRHPNWRISHSPSYTSDMGSWIAYHHVSFISVQIADWIRELGYAAKANSCLTGYDIIMPPHEIEAGLGEQSRIGVTLHPVLGPAFKSAAVLTSLPLETDRPIEFNLESFCEKCEKCARECPPNAIPRGKGKKVNTRGVTKWQPDALRCSSYWTLNNRYDFPGAHDACARCIYVCPWTKQNSEAWPHRLVVAMVSNFPLIQKFAIKMDDIAGYGKQVKTDASWEKWF
jgi:reductive dehalogenase